KKAFIVNRIGDFAFLVGMFALYSHFGSLRYREVFARIASAPEIALSAGGLGLTVVSLIALCFFVGAMGKSAQIPLYVWLPDAMAGPTPVSALIHAATMVTAGVYMVARSNLLYQLSPGVSAFVAAIGATTALFAATIGLAQTDIKKVLAYSTVSQLGYMFLAAGLGAYSTAVFHVMTHAFFKALLFLGSGSVIHAMSGEQDMRRMGGLKSALPITYWTFLIGALAIAGIFPFAGFFSKDAILAAAAGSHNWFLYGVGLLTAGITAFYMFRAVFLTFFGTFRGTEEQRHHLHESPASMTVPLVILAVGAIGAGWVGIPEAFSFGHAWDRWGEFLKPTVYHMAGLAQREHHLSAGVEAGLAALSLAVAIVGILLARRIYGGPAGAERGAAWEAGHAEVQEVLAHKYYVDEIYDKTIVRPLAWTSRVVLWKVFDNVVIDGLIKAGAFFVDVTGHAGRLTTTGNIRNYAIYFFLGVLLLFWWMTLS
ncbi:MAG TPA: NADH-quinone oxidoreductase subunit L, partial [Thermoanaerobaculia bacterium]|nr:NADH-quinone oxidoreductase subunit L [Thermoanaerobaculia bacterium]